MQFVQRSHFRGSVLGVLCRRRAGYRAPSRGRGHGKLLTRGLHPWEPINAMTRTEASYFRCALDDPHISYPGRRGVCGCTIELQSAPVHRRCCCLCSSFTGVTSCVVTCTSCLHCISLSTCVHLCVFDETEVGWQL